MSGTQKRWPGETDKAYPEVFNNPPPFPSQLKPGQLSQEQFKRFFDEGYLLIEEFFNVTEELDPGVTAINALVDDLANKLYNGGKVKSLYKDLGYHERLTMLERDFPGANVILHKLGKLPQAFRDIWSNERLLNLAEQILGTADIMGHPNWNIRTKTPQSEATIVPWHQDAGYLENCCYGTLQLTCWIPLMNATVENGCMQVVRNAHKSGKVAMHQCCYGGTWYLMTSEDEMIKTLGCDMSKDVVTVPVPYGGLLLLNNITPHQGLPNTSSEIRWSLDFRFQASGTPVGEYLLKPAIPLRSSTEPDFKIDWEPFDSINRHQRSFEALNIKENEFDTTIPGPWMKKWEIVHMNRHTDALANIADDKWGHLTLE